MVTELDAACFEDLGEAAVYTPPGGGDPVTTRAILDEPTEPPFPRELPRSAFRERLTSVWLPQALAAGKDGTLVISGYASGARTFVLVSLQQQDGDRAQWAVRGTG